jgi:hypothetical protein
LWLNSNFSGTVEETGTCHGKFMDQLKIIGEWDHTLFVVPADLGETLGAHI